MAPDPPRLSTAAAAAGVDAPTSNPAAVLAATAKHLRVALDSGADADHASVASLLALARAAASVNDDEPDGNGRSLAFAHDVNALASALGISVQDTASNGMVPEGSDEASSKGRGTTATNGALRIKLRPAAAKAATERLLRLVKGDSKLGRLIEGEKATKIEPLPQPRRRRKSDAAATPGTQPGRRGADDARQPTVAPTAAAKPQVGHGQRAGSDTKENGVGPGRRKSATGSTAPQGRTGVPRRSVPGAGVPSSLTVDKLTPGTGGEDQRLAPLATAPSLVIQPGVVGPSVGQPQPMPATSSTEQQEQAIFQIQQRAILEQQQQLQLLQKQVQVQQQELLKAQQQQQQQRQQQPQPQPQQQLQLQPQPQQHHQQQQTPQPHLSVPTGGFEDFEDLDDPATVAADRNAFAALQAMDQFMAPLAFHFGVPPAASSLTDAQSLRYILAERERVMYGLSQERQAELSAIPETMPEDVRRRAIIEGKELRLLELQRVIRHKVASEDRRVLGQSVDHTTLDSDPSPSATVPYNDLVRLFRRNSPHVYSYRDGYPRPSLLDGIPEPPSRSPQTLTIECHRMAQFDYSRMSKQRVEKRRLFGQRLMQHYQSFSLFHGTAWSDRNRVGKGFQKYFVDKKRQEEKRKKMEQMERLRLLRDNDEEAYLKLLKNTKNQRLLQLVSQTDNYLMQIGAKIEKNRDGPATGPPVPHAGDVVGEAPDTVEDMRRRRSQYYTVTHTVTEDVRQPSIMVNGVLKPYQLEGLRWMVSLYNNNLNGILADEMGLGKTIQTISLITYLIDIKKNSGPYLIVVPLSTLGNWVREFEKWAPAVIKVAYRGDLASRRELQATALRSPFNVLLTTYEFVVRDQAVLGRISWEYIIIDEGHRMKNANSKMALTLGTRYRSRNRLLLTGTPLQNNLTELWALLNFLLPDIFSSSDTFEQWFKKPFEQTTMGDSAELEEEETYLIINRLHQVLRPFLLRRLKTDVEAQLPEKVETVIRCDMSVWQRVLYRQMQKRITVATGEEGTGSTRRFNNLLMQLKKICNHPFIFYDDAEVAKLPDDMLIRSSGKFCLLAHMLAKFKRANHRTLIFSQMTSALDYMEDFLSLIGFQYMRLDGSTKSEDRQGMLNLFNAEDSPYFCFLLSTRAGGLGLNLQTADTVIIFDSDWNPMMDLQAQDRAHRIGQTQEVRVIRLISAGTVEVKILDQANRKLQVDAQVIQAGQFNNKSTDTDRETMLKSILRSQADGAEKMGDRCPDKEELNRMIARSDEEFDLYQEIDQERGDMDDVIAEESDLPAWVLQPEVDFKTAEERAKEEMETYGRGRRKRSAIRDVDQLTESEWLMVMEGEITAEEALARRERLAARRRKKTGHGVAQIDDDQDHADKNGDGSDVLSDDGDAEEPDPTFTKSGRVVRGKHAQGGRRGERRAGGRGPGRSGKRGARGGSSLSKKRQRPLDAESGESNDEGDDESEELGTPESKRRKMNGSSGRMNGHVGRPHQSANNESPGSSGDSDSADGSGGLEDMRDGDGVKRSRRGRRSVAFADEVVDNAPSSVGKPSSGKAKRGRGRPRKIVAPRGDEGSDDDKVNGMSSGTATRADLMTREEATPALSVEVDVEDGIVSGTRSLKTRKRTRGDGSSANPKRSDRNVQEQANEHDEETDGGAEDGKNDDERRVSVRTSMRLRVRPPR